MAQFGSCGQLQLVVDHGGRAGPTLCWAGAAGRPPGEFIFPPTMREKIMKQKIILLSLRKAGLSGVSPMPEAVMKAQTANNSHPVH